MEGKKLTRANLSAFERLRKNTTFNALSQDSDKYPQHPSTVSGALWPDAASLRLSRGGHGCTVPPIAVCSAANSHSLYGTSPKINMLETLETIERELPSLLETHDGWKTLDINYHPPHVERVVRRWRDYRIYLHRIHPCKSSEALFHPHPWPSAMHILSGVYEMAIGYGAGEQPPPFAAKLIASGDLKYEMTEPDAWHYVRPIDEVAMTIMITGTPWDRWSPGTNASLKPLADEVRDEILDFFRSRFPKLL